MYILYKQLQDQHIAVLKFGIPTANHLILKGGGFLTVGDIESEF